jgi:eukaryotic-like serine/threonine-protein kinase
LALSPGDRLGVYEIVAPLGAGGMGQVYRAQDTRLNRVVAVKAMHESFAQNPERAARFEREAQLLASLNHPNIAAIYGVEEAQGSTFLVLEFVDGRSLADMLKSGAMHVPEAFAVAKQIADALASAHERGIIHRDLKPANVMVTADGEVKVLDFGLGKTLDGEGSPGGDPSAPSAHSPTMTMAATQAGLIMGTAGYMSPEQAKGRAADRRSDVWAFGCVLYEMLTGRKAFEGEDITDTLAAIVRGEPDWALLPAGLSPSARVLLERCLVKDRSQRISDMSVARFLMSDTAQSLSGASRATEEKAPTGPARRVLPPVLATAAIVGIATFGLTRWLEPADITRGDGVAHVSVLLPDGVEMGSTHLLPLALSHDGTRVAFVGASDGKNQIYVRTLSDPEPKALIGTDGGDSPFFSPDGQWIAFFSGSKLRKIAVGGAALQTLADAPFHRGGDWGDDGYIYFAPTNMTGIWRVPESGGVATEVTRREPTSGEISHRWPQLIAGTRTLVFGVWTGPGDDEHHVAVQTVGEAEHHVIVRGGDAPRCAAKLGVLLYTRLGELFAAPWRPPQTDLGRAVPVATSEHPNDSIGNEGCGNYAVSDDGALAYLAGGRTRNGARLVWIDRAGARRSAALPERAYENVAISPDGTRAIVQIRGSVTTLWMHDFGRNSLTPIGSSPGSSQAPLWTADGTRVIYRGTRQGSRNLYWRAVDGTGDEERLTTKPDVSQTPTSVTPDGRWLAFNENGAQEPGGVGIWVMRLDGDRKPQRLFAAPAGEVDGQFSPDGKWIAYQVTVSSREEIYVAPFPGPGARHQISTDGGTEPLWSRDGRELFFQNGPQLMVVEVAPGAALSAGVPHLVHEGRFFKTINGNSSWSVTPDGKRFLRIQQVEPERAITSFELVLNWFSELKERAAGAK